MNQLLYNFLNEIEDVNKIKEMSAEEFTKLVKANKLISDEDAKVLIESFKKISTKKSEEDDETDSDQRRKKYRQQHKTVDAEINPIKTKNVENKERDEDAKER
jgi:hypothetical protein